MKKRTGAHSAMAELLSKSNETQIKDKGTQVKKRIPIANENKEMHTSGPRKISPQPQGNVADNRPVRHNTRPMPRRPIQSGPMDEIKGVATNPAQPRPMPHPRATGKSPYQAGPMAELRGATQRRAPVNYPERTRTAGAPQRNTAVTSPQRPTTQTQPTKRAQNTPVVRREKRKRHFPIKVFLSFAAVLILAVAVFAAVKVISAMQPEPEIIPEISCGSKPLKVSASAPYIGNTVDEDATPRHTVTVDVFEGEKVVCSTEATTVGDILEKMDVEISADHVLRLSEEDAVSADTVINYDKITYGTETSTASVPFETKYKDVQNIPRGSTKIVQTGKNGVSTATYKITYVNGVETERVLQSEVITTYPTNQVVNRGVGGTVTIGGKSYSYSYYIDCKTTVYTGGGITASGLPATEKVIAVDPRVIPLGTQVYVADPYCYVGIRTAADTGGAIKGNFIDIYFDEDNPSLWGYGVRSARVYILD